MPSPLSRNRDPLQEKGRGKAHLGSIGEEESFLDIFFLRETISCNQALIEREKRPCAQHLPKGESIWGLHHNLIRPRTPKKRRVASMPIFDKGERSGRANRRKKRKKASGEILFQKKVRYGMKSGGEGKERRLCTENRLPRTRKEYCLLACQRKEGGRKLAHVGGCRNFRRGEIRVVSFKRGEGRKKKVRRGRGKRTASSCGGVHGKKGVFFL